MNNIKLTTALRIVIALVVTAALATPEAFADSAREIDIKADEALKRFKKEVSAGEAFLREAKAVLVFPEVIKAGFGVGGEYGEGALRIKGKTVEYYSTASASIGWQAGAQTKIVVLVFLEKSAVEKFRISDGWEAGVDGSVAVLDEGVAKDVSTESVKDPIIGFVFGNKGLMFNLTLEGSKFSKIVR